jgi:hypothetical protein
MKKLTLMRMAIVVATVALVPSILPASATPVCYEAPEAACGFRIFAEAYQTASFLQHGNGEYEGGIKALAARFPRYVRVNSLDVLLNDPEAVSFGDRKIWVIEVTDFQADEDGKLPVVVSTGVHATEPAGREGSVRYAEDLVRWATTDPGHLLRNGTEPDSTAFPVSKVLQSVHLYLAAINPDGWEAGDLANGGLYNRGNDNGEDLNREFPTIGWTNAGNLPLTAPEAIAWTRFVELIDPVTTADLHGELDSANNAYADIMLPAGQWDPLVQAQHEAMARHMKSNIDRYFREQTVALGQIEEVPLQPAEYATGYDVVGYDAAGFMGDFFTQQGAVDLDIEHMLSHIVPSSVWIPLHEHAHIAAVRAEIETIMVEAMVTSDVQVQLDLGTTGYLFDPRVVTDSDANGYGVPSPPDEFVSYSATPMVYFEDLSKFTAEPLQAVSSGGIVAEDYVAGPLSGLDSFVVTTWPLPPDPEGRQVNKNEIVSFISSFVQRGGNLILTDEGLKLLEELDVVADGAVTKTLWQAGHVDITDFDDPYADGLHTTASQTYYEVALGYRANGQSDRQAPHWTVPLNAWEAGGGITVGTIGGQTGFGRISLGQGRIGIIGALLPPATEQWDHHYGLADYALSVTGGQILNNMLEAA